MRHQLIGIVEAHTDRSDDFAFGITKGFNAGLKIASAYLGLKGAALSSGRATVGIQCPCSGKQSRYGMADAILPAQAKRDQRGTGERSQTIFEISGPHHGGDVLRQWQ